jgi:NADH:ubiquinone oxidoreductase subunit D
VSGNVIIQQRTRDVGVMDGKTALAFGTTGPALRASGVPWDLRRTDPYGAYGQVKFSVAVGSRGDCWDRYWVRVEEMRQSLKIIEQLIDGIPEGKYTTIKPAAKIRLPAGRHYGQVETARGVLGCTIVSTGGETPYRIHMRSPSFNNLWCLTKIAPGWRVADLVAMISTLDFVVPDMDR